LVPAVQKNHLSLIVQRFNKDVVAGAASSEKYSQPAGLFAANRGTSLQRWLFAKAVSATFTIG
jgi:hypothetical protein